MKILLTLWGCLRSNWASQVALLVKNPPVNAGDARGEGSIPRSGRSTVGGNGDALQYSYLKNFNGQRSLAGYSLLLLLLLSRFRRV